MAEPEPLAPDAEHLFNELVASDERVNALSAELAATRLELQRALGAAAAYRALLEQERSARPAARRH